MSQENGYVNQSVTNGIASVEFFHPMSNSLPSEILTKLANTIRDLGQDNTVKVIVLRSSGEKVFCSGASFDELIAINDIESGKKFFSGFAQVINAMRQCNQLIIARVQGKAVGGGVGLISAADYAIGTEKSSIKLSELAVGIGPFVVGPAVEKKLGTAAFAQLAIDATEWRTAAWAKEHSLYAEVHATIDEVDIAVDKLANKLATSNPEAMAELKSIIWKGTEDWDQLLIDRAAISGRLVVSDFTRNAINAFKKKD